MLIGGGLRMRIAFAAVVMAASLTGARADTLGGLLVKGAVKAAVGSPVAKVAPKVATGTTKTTQTTKVADAAKSEYQPSTFTSSNIQQTGKCVLDRRFPDSYGPVKFCDMREEKRKKKQW
jgi:hypothetical protein